MIPFWLFDIFWHWRNRTWKNTRQKRKAFRRDWRKYAAAKRK